MFWQRLATLFCSNPRKKILTEFFFRKIKKLESGEVVKKGRDGKRGSLRRLVANQKRGFSQIQPFLHFKLDTHKKIIAGTATYIFFKVSFSASVFDDRWQFRKLSLKQETKFASRNFLTKNISVKKSNKAERFRVLFLAACLQRLLNLADRLRQVGEGKGSWVLYRTLSIVYGLWFEPDVSK